MKQEESFFGDEELGLVYIAKRLKEALKLEEVLTQAGVEYLVEPDHYRGGIIFQTERIGAFFYVPIVALPSTRELMQRNGYKPFVPESPET